MVSSKKVHTDILYLQQAFHLDVFPGILQKVENFGRFGYREHFQATQVQSPKTLFEVQRRPKKRNL